MEAAIANIDQMAVEKGTSTYKACSMNQQAAAIQIKIAYWPPAFMVKYRGRNGSLSKLRIRQGGDMEIKSFT
ncbi:MAG: hypothetical protein Q9O62_10415 [Ardenticatenia bacterium]|nr:hypothetical protein [Ardenticatenia bacterium]